MDQSWERDRSPFRPVALTEENEEPHQKRNWKTNIGILAFPILLCLLIAIIQNVVNREMDKVKHQCGCRCVDTDGDGKCKKVCNLSADQEPACPVRNPSRWPPLIQVPGPENRAIRVDYIPYNDQPNGTCRMTKTCPATVIFTGRNKSFAENLAENLFMSPSALNFSHHADALPNLILGTEVTPGTMQFIEPGLFGQLYVLQPNCPPNFTLKLHLTPGDIAREVECIEVLPLWRSNASLVNDELFKGYQHGNVEKKSNEITAAYDFLASNEKQLSVNIWYNATYRNSYTSGVGLVRLPRLVNMVILTYLVYEKQHKLKIMMKMHGLGDEPYWTISYFYFLLLSSLYVLCFVIFGSLIGLLFFKLNDYGIQFVFFFIYINLQIALALFMATFFSNVKTATVMGYIYVFGSGLLGSSLLKFFVEDASFSRVRILLMEIIPCFSLYRGIYELSQYTFFGNSMGTSGMQWSDLNDHDNGMKSVMILMSIEWLVLILVAYYLDQVGSLGDMFRRNYRFPWPCFQKKQSFSSQDPSFRFQQSKVSVDMEKDDVFQEI